MMKKFPAILFVFLLLSLTTCRVLPSQNPDEPEPTATKGEGDILTEGREFPQTAGEDEVKGFSIFIVQSDSPASELQADLDTLTLEPRPIISTDDIEEYIWAGHEIRLTPSANFRLVQFQRQALSKPGLPFVICVGSERIYQGMFWSSYSSVPYDGHVIDLYPAEHQQPIRIQIGYPTEEWFTGVDMRADPRVYSALKSAGKLR